MKKLNRIFCFFGLWSLGIFASTSCIGQVTWTGGGDGINWTNADNWFDGVSTGVPTSTDDVLIPDGNTVQINVAGQVAQSVFIELNSTLNITLMGSLTIDGVGGGGFSPGILLNGGGTLSIAENASLTILNTGFDGIAVTESLSTIDNAGTITIGPNIGDSFGHGIYVGVGDGGNIGSLNLTNQATGLITSATDVNIEINFLFIQDGPGTSIIDNLGTIDVDMDNSGGDFIGIEAANASFFNRTNAVIKVENVAVDAFYFINGSTFTNETGGMITATNVGSDAFNFQDGSTFTNEAGGMITVNNINADAFNFDGGSTLDNSGTINATTIGDQGLDISTPGSGTNHATGIINITGVRNEEAIDVTGTFTNDGVLNISDIQLLLTSGQSAIHVNSATGSFINNNLINLALTKADIAIEVDVDADLTNSVCAVINITTENPIINNGTITNEGTISTVFSGTNTNTGIFINNGVIASPNSLFKIGGTDNALIGTGAVQTSTTGIISGSTTVCTGTNSTLLTLSEHSGTIQNWESSTDINFSSPTTIMNMLTTYTAMDLTGTTYYRAVIKNGACDAVNSGIATITVDQPSVGGTVIGSTTVCTGTNSTTLALIGKTGTIQNWESSTDIGFSSPTTISNTTNTIEATNLTATTYYRAVVKNGACDAANSSIATVTVDPTSVGGTIAGAATVCTGTNSTLLTLSGHTGEIQNWESSTDINFISPAPTTIANTNTTLTVENLTTTTHYRAVIKSGVCSSVNSGTTTVTVSADPLTVGGTISGATTVCTGTNSTDLTLSGHTGSILRWESATDNIFTSPSTINNLDFGRKDVQKK